MDDRIDRGEPGRSARREYERRRARREAHLRSRYGALGGMASAVASQPQHTMSWLQGEAGEVHAAAHLERRLAGTGVILLHDRAIPRSRANLDHVAVGPGGITVIDAKAIAGKVRVESRGGPFAKRTRHLVVGRRDRTKLIDGVERQLEVVRAVFGDCDVRGALCWVKVDGLPASGALEMRGVRIDGPKALAKLAARPGALSAAEVQDLAARVARRFPAA
jgi:hypothetical protein